MRPLFRLVAVLTVLSAGSLAHADTITTFRAVGSDAIEDPGRNDTLSGTLTVNTTTGVFTGVDLSLSDGPEFTIVNEMLFSSNYTEVLIGIPGHMNQAALFLFTSLVGYSGSSFVLDTPYGVFDSQATPLVTPEPSSIALLSTGLLGIGAAVRRRFTAPARSQESQ